MNIAIITGEASGDRVGGQLAEEIRKLRPDIHLWGTGGKHLRSAGVETVVDSARWGVIGVVAGLQILPRVLSARRYLLKEMLKRRPDVVIPIDAGAFNIGFPGVEGLCPFLRRLLPQTKIVYYFPPGSWRRSLKSSPLSRLADKVATPFPWSESELRRLGVDAVFVGHALLDLVKPSLPSDTFATKYGIDSTRPVVGILPGSRSQEIDALLPVQLRAASIIHQRVPSVQFLIALAPTVDRSLVQQAIEKEQMYWTAEARRKREIDASSTIDPSLPGTVPVMAQGTGRPLTPSEIDEQRKKWLARAAEIPEYPSGKYPIAIVEDATYDVMAASDVLLITSGTATLEAAILGKPMVITYRMSNANWLEYQIIKDRMPKYIGMPNILAERGIVPEYIHDAATPDALAQEVIGLLLEPDRMLRMREDLRTTTNLLGEPGGAKRTAEMVIDLLESRNGNVLG